MPERTDNGRFVTEPGDWVEIEETATGPGSVIECPLCGRLTVEGVYWHMVDVHDVRRLLRERVLKHHR
jgi:hypothetical protein